MWLARARAQVSEDSLAWAAWQGAHLANTFSVATHVPPDFLHRPQQHDGGGVVDHALPEDQAVQHGGRVLHSMPQRPVLVSEATLSASARLVLHMQGRTARPPHAHPAPAQPYRPLRRTWSRICRVATLSVELKMVPSARLSATRWPSSPTLDRML